VSPLRGTDDEQLYTVKGLDPVTGPLGAVETVVFGMVGDRFVVASDAGSARAIAAAPVETVDGAEGAGVARADLRGIGAELTRDLFDGLETLELGDLVGELEASTSGLEARLSVEVPGGLE